MAVKTIGQDGLDDLGIDEFNRLYWKGERVVTETMIDLPAWVDFAVGAAAVATVVIVLKNGAQNPIVRHINIKLTLGSVQILWRWHYRHRSSTS